LPSRQDGGSHGHGAGGRAAQVNLLAGARAIARHLVDRRRRHRGHLGPLGATLLECQFGRATTARARRARARATRRGARERVRLGGRRREEGRELGLFELELLKHHVARHGGLTQALVNQALLLLPRILSLARSERDSLVMIVSAVPERRLRRRWLRTAEVVTLVLIGWPGRTHAA
jgi:hypothetical protein